MESENIKMAYVAGIMDGDGSFSIIKHKTDASPLYYPFLQFANWRKEIIDFLKVEFGGNITIRSAYIGKDGSEGKSLMVWRLRSNDNVLPVINRLIPFLKIKSERAQFLRRFIEELPFVRGRRVPIEKLEEKERFYIGMMQSNDWTSFNNSISSKVASVVSEEGEFWAYVAGLMDTDGSFSVKKQVHNKGTWVINPRYMPVISLAMSDARAINYVRENFPFGKLYIPRNTSCSNGFHYQYGIYTKKESIEFLKRVIPFLKAKKANAEVLLHFCESSVNTLSCRKGIDPKELKFRDNCYVKLVNLNKYGVSKSPLIDLKLLPDNAGDNKGQATNVCSLNAVSEETIDDDGCGTLDSIEI
jgi:hypothetical protein